MILTEKNIFNYFADDLENMGPVPFTRIPNCLKVSVVPLGKVHCVIMVTGIGPNGQPLSTAVPDRLFGSFMTELERSVESFRYDGSPVGWSIGRKESCDEHTKDMIHSLKAHRMIFLRMRDVPAWLLSYERSVKQRKWKREGLTVKYTRPSSLDFLAKWGHVFTRHLGEE
ncbi:hypothetical protein D3C81_1684430 [compost metagenome]